MKKLAAFTIFCILFFSVNDFSSVNTRLMMKTGVLCPDFIIGMKGDTVYSLKDFLSHGKVVLAFMDKGSDSVNFKNLILSFKGKIPGADTVWFNITFSSSHAIIEAVLGGLGIRYRTLKNNIPDLKKISCFPSIIILDKNGMVQFIYSGYSPTAMNDIAGWLEKSRLH